MPVRSCLVLVIGVITACGSPDEGFVGEVTAPVVYGPDDRVEVFNHPDAELRGIAQQSILALIPNFRIIREPGGDYSLFTSSLRTRATSAMESSSRSNQLRRPAQACSSTTTWC